MTQLQIKDDRPHKLGIMLGQLTLPVSEHHNAAQYWQPDMRKAAEMGFDFVEWLVSECGDTNPILTATGRKEMIEATHELGIQIPVAYVNYLGFTPLTSTDPAVREEARSLLEEIINVAPEAGVNRLEIPLMNKANIWLPRDEDEIIRLVARLFSRIDDSPVKLLFKTSLAPGRAAGFINRMPSWRCGISYDTGDSMYWEFDPDKELRFFGYRVDHVHIKDSRPEFDELPVGQGDVDFHKIFTLLGELGYKGDFVVRPTCHSAGDDEQVNDAMGLTKGWIDQYLK